MSITPSRPSRSARISTAGRSARSLDPAAAKPIAFAPVAVAVAMVAKACEAERCNARDRRVECRGDFAAVLFVSMSSAVPVRARTFTPSRLYLPAVRFQFEAGGDEAAAVFVALAAHSKIEAKSLQVRVLGRRGRGLSACRFRTMKSTSADHRRKLTTYGKNPAKKQVELDPTRRVGAPVAGCMLQPAPFPNYCRLKRYFVVQVVVPFTDRRRFGNRAQRSGVIGARTRIAGAVWPRNVTISVVRTIS